MSANVLNNDTHVNGTLSAKTFNPPNSSITDAAILANAGIQATKVVHQFPLVVEQAPGTAVVAQTKLLHIVRAGCTVVSIEAATPTIATGADRTVTIDLQKGNAGNAFATILTAPVVLDNTNANRTPEAGTIASPTLLDNDILQVVITVAGAAGNQAQGLIVTITLRESPQ